MVRIATVACRWPHTHCVCVPCSPCYPGAQVFEVFGPVSCPLYLVRLNPEQQPPPGLVVAGAPVFAVKQYSQFILKARVHEHPNAATVHPHRACTHPLSCIFTLSKPSCTHLDAMHRTSTMKKLVKVYVVPLPPAVVQLALHCTWSRCLPDACAVQDQEFSDDEKERQRRAAKRKTKR